MVGVDAGERRARELRLGKWTKAIREWVSTVGNGKHRKTQVENKGICGGRGCPQAHETRYTWGICIKIIQ